MHSASSLLVLVGNLLCLALATICNAVGSQVPQLRAPALFWNHGSGPYPFLYPDDNAHKETVSFWKHEARQILRFDDAAAMRPKALVIISAHNEDQAEMGAVNINNAQDNIPLDKHDNPGFDPKSEPTYDQLEYPAKGSRVIADKIAKLLGDAGIKHISGADSWNHDIYVPMHFVNPAADIPIVAVSVAKQNASGVNANLHYRIGRALEPLRDQNIAIIGSGMSMHNTNNGKTPVSNIAEFISAIESACSIPDPDARGDALSKWTSFPYALSAFKPSKAVRTNTADSHLMPLMVAAGSAGYEVAKSKRMHFWHGYPLTAIWWEGSSASKSSSSTSTSNSSTADSTALSSENSSKTNGNKSTSVSDSKEEKNAGVLTVTMTSSFISVFTITLIFLFLN